MNLAALATRARALLAALCLLVCAFSPAARAAGTPWPDVPYSYQANQAKLDTVLADFATGFSLSLAMQPDVSGTVNGRFSTRNPTEFISRLAGIYGFVWYTHAGTLFVSRASDVVTRGLAAPGGNVATMRKALTDLGVLEPRFGWGELSEHGIALVSGPPSYVNLIQGTIRNLPARAQQLAVFRLKHAAAEDRVVSYRDQQIRTPGLASVLRTLVAAGAAQTPGAVHSAGVPLATLPTAVALGTGGAASPGAGLGLGSANGAANLAGAAAAQQAAQQAAQTAQAAQAAAQAGGAPTPMPSIQADQRLNAVLVQDLPERIPMYQQLIEQLDVATSLVEIEAMIIDVNSDRANELGVNWSGRVGRASLGFGQPAATNGLAAAFSSGSAAAGDFLLTQLRLLESNGDAEVQSRPSVLTSENLGALLDLSETFYIRSLGERVANVTPVTAGTTLRVTPHVVDEGGRKLVQLKIDIEDGQIAERQVDTLPIVRRSVVSTEATVLHGEALLIAGYRANQSIKTRQQIPVLGDIPGIGVLFSNEVRTVQKRERLFLIRPKVVGLPGQALYVPEAGAAGAAAAPAMPATPAAR